MSSKRSGLRTVGLLGGMSWQSTQTYYRLLNEGVAHRCGGTHSAPLILHSFDFRQIEAFQENGDWAAAGACLGAAAAGLEQAGAEAIIIATNTMHRLADDVSRAVSIPLLHIVDATAQAIMHSDARASLLLATAYTMQQDFYKAPLQDYLKPQGGTLFTPEPGEQKIIHQIIYEELCCGTVRDDSRRLYLDIIDAAVRRHGCDSVILGCTEIGLLIAQHDTELTVFDTTWLHCQQALQFICERV